MTEEEDKAKSIRRALLVARRVTPSRESNDAALEQIAKGNIPETPHRVTTKFLQRQVAEALQRHLALPPEQRVQSSVDAENALAKFLGRTNKGKGNVKDLLAKNTKLLKTEKGAKGGEPLKMTDGRGVETTGLPLSPAYEDKGFNLCPNHASCKALCLGLTSGQYHAGGGGEDLRARKGPRLKSLLRTLAFLHDPGAFAIKLHDEIEAAKQEAHARGNHQGMRLNVLSDISPRVWQPLMNAHSDVSFYDYTKLNGGTVAPNHHLTYSSTGLNQPEATYDVEHRPADPSKGLEERPAAKGKGVVNPNQNWHYMRQRLDEGKNVAMAFSHKKFLPETLYDEETGKRYQVVDGDTHDFRPFDTQPDGSSGVIIGLKNKQITAKSQNAAYLSKGFFVHYDPQVDRPETYERGPSLGMNKAGKPKPGPILNPGKPQNTEVRVAPQPRPNMKHDAEGVSEDMQGAARPLRAHGGPIKVAGGGFVVDRHNGLDIEDYAHQFPGLEHHEEQDEDTVRRKWYEPLERKMTPADSKSSPDIAIRIARAVIRKSP